ncbi:MAG: dehydratase, partial [Candidatus Binatia bacterium]
VIVDHFCDGNSRRLSRLYARFARPVFPGQEISTTVWPWEDTNSTKVYAYATYNPDGKEVIKDGIAEITTT